MADPDYESFRLKTVRRDRTRNVFELVFASLEPPDKPSWIPEDDWYGGGSGDEYTFAVPANAVRRATVVAPTGIAKTIDVTTGQIVYHKYTYNGTTWVNPIPCDHLGVPL